MSNNTTTEPTARFLDDDAMARIEALKAARKVLEATGLVNRDAVDKIDLIDVARYIVEGQDPNATPVPSTPMGDDQP